MTGDFEIDDLLHRHGKAIAKAIAPPRTRSPVEQFVCWMFARSYSAAERKTKRRVSVFVVGMTFFAWLVCQALVDDYYNGRLYDEAREIAMREHYWNFFVQLRHLSRSK
jgi:hypothetical protein